MPVGLRDVPVERRGIELRQHEDAADVRVQAVADRDVDQPVLAADRHRRLGAGVGERKQAAALPAAEDDGQDVSHVGAAYAAVSAASRPGIARLEVLPIRCGPRSASHLPRSARWRMQRLRPAEVVHSMALTISVIVCAYNEERYRRGVPPLAAGADAVPPTKSSSSTTPAPIAPRAVAAASPASRVVDEPRKGLVDGPRDRAARPRPATCCVYLDADCRAPLQWLERVERRFAQRAARFVAVTGPYRFYDWDWWGRVLIRALRPHRWRR